MSKPTHTRRALRSSLPRAGAAAVLALSLALGATACGLNAQTLQPYTQAEGVNVDAGGYDGVKVRNLMIITDASGKGILSGALVAQTGDDLAGVTGRALNPDGTPAGSLTVALPGGKIALPKQQLVVLTDGAASTVSGAAMKPGLTAELQLVFTKSGLVTVTVPIVDNLKPDYQTVSPSPAASPST